MPRPIKLDPQDPLLPTYHGTQLRSYLYNNGIAHNELARLLNKTPSTVNGYVNRWIIHPKTRQDIAQALGVPQGQIFRDLTGTESPSGRVEVNPDDADPSLPGRALEVQQAVGNISEQVNLLRVGTVKDRSSLRQEVMSLLTLTTRLLSDLDQLHL